MKKTKFLSFIIALFLVFSITAIPNKSNQTDVTVDAITGDYTLNPSEFHIANYYSYRMNQAFTKTTDSFEAWINVPANSTGGAIFSNYIGGDAIVNHHHVDYSIDVSGRVRVDWGNTNVIVFNKGFVADGNWHHIAVVRDKTAKTFTLYVDGQLNTVASAFNMSEPISERPFSIGVDLNMESTAKRPLNNGRIKQITVYNGAITAERVAQDMNNTYITTDDTNAELLANVYLGEPWTQRVVEDTSGNGNYAKLASYEKLVAMVSPGEYDYSIAVIPDVQTTVHWKSQATHVSDASQGYISNEPPATYNESTGAWSAYDSTDTTHMGKWINFLKSTPSTYNTKFGIQVGDLSDYGQYEIHYKWSSYYMSQLNGVLPWSFVQGNHDYDLNCDGQDARYSTYYNKYFPYSLHSTLSGFGGAKEEGSMSNTYYKYEVDGIKYLVLNLEFGPRMDVLRWAGRLCEEYYDYRVIVNTHGYMEADGSLLQDGEKFAPNSYAWASATEVTSGQTVYDELVSKYKNIFLVVCGHITAEDIVMRTDYGVHGNKITSLLIDFQTAEYRNSGAGTEATCMMFFNESEKTINFAYYSAYYEAVYNVQNQFRISFADANNPTIGA